MAADGWVDWRISEQRIGSGCGNCLAADCRGDPEVVALDWQRMSGLFGLFGK